MYVPIKMEIHVQLLTNEIQDWGPWPYSGGKIWAMGDRCILLGYKSDMDISLNAYFVFKHARKSYKPYAKLLFKILNVANYGHEFGLLHETTLPLEIVRNWFVARWEMNVAVLHDFSWIEVPVLHLFKVSSNQ